ncbi:MAG: hypothetical protein A2X13_04890 [Bacteroidetes bacterium GWC2_33_15]|nr:MAG: hypothetical protein A2X10_12760 [Bacteroidetes bacterium GWA2_33_15]OFX50930.1 MAG: hypothetical protein A2X13_04890 [Bacteroidetes bacterium GWC2_33_15]OFX66565.1 MAG: hypothetical protein A2X15_15470 [Bacteroidetes bacterium GWB2_32_14]OFX70156.1 MAG: hypothetical protein A2X14_12650 [Bacteroidetes bacterium GWD2_33_33]HAN20033.1 peroxide stress protein YaaA [Bacteroidales bacterium]
MLHILSPAKTLDYKNQVQTSRFTQPDLLSDSKMLVQELVKLNPKDLGKLMGINSELAVLNFERNLSWRLPFTPDNSKQALAVFKGQVYIGLNANTLSENDLFFAQDHLRILSGLYGVLRPLDLIQPYRLEMGTELANPRGKNLYHFWGTTLTESINAELSKHKQKVLIHLASNEYYKAINPKQIKGKIITPVFKEFKGNEFKQVTIYAKTARGYMSRFIIQNRIENPEDLKAFDTDGYLFNRGLSTENQWVFTR